MLWRLDWILILAIAGLCFIGSLLVYSATRVKLADAGLDPMSELKKHILNIAIGVCLAAFVTLFDYRMLRAYAPIIYVASILGLLAVLSPLGSTHQRRALVDPAAGRLLGAAVGVRQGRDRASASRCCSRRRADGEDEPRDIDVVRRSRSPRCRSG